MTKTARIKAELLALQARSSDKMLHAHKVVAWARAHPKSAIFSEIEWDAEKAATEYRLWQVRRLIQIHVTVAAGTPVLVSLTLDRGGGGGYRAIDDVVADRDMSAVMLKDALNELTRIQAKYARVSDLVSVWAEVERVRVRASRPKEERAQATA